MSRVKFVCPHCEGRMDDFVEPDGARIKPRANDIAMCIHCGSIMRLDDKLMPTLLDASALGRMRVELPDLFHTLARAQREIVLGPSGREH